MAQNNSRIVGRSVSIWPTAWKFALIIAAFRVIYSLSLQTTGMADTRGLGLLGILVSVVLLVVALRSFRRRNDGYMTFGQGFGVAFIASAVSTVVRAAVDAIYLAAFGQEQLAAQLEGTLSQVRANPAVDDRMMEAMRSTLEVVFTPGGIFIMAAVFGTIGLAVVSLILAAALKNPPPITD